MLVLLSKNDTGVNFWSELVVNTDKVARLCALNSDRPYRNIQRISYAYNSDHWRQLILYRRENSTGTAGKYEWGLAFVPGPTCFHSDFPAEMLRLFASKEEHIRDVAAKYYSELIEKWVYRIQYSPN